MGNVATWFAEGGWGMYPVLLFGGASAICGVAHAAVARNVTLLVTVSVAGLTLLAGMAATWSGRNTTEAAIAAVSPEMRERIRMVGFAEARHPTELALGVLALVMLPLLIGEARRMMRSPAATNGGSNR